MLDTEYDRSPRGVPILEPFACLIESEGRGGLDVCVIESKQIKKIKKEEFDESKHTTDLSRCKETPEEIEICVIESKQI